MLVFTYSLAGIYSFVWVTECASSAETQKIQISVVVHAFASVTDFIFEIQMSHNLVLFCVQSWTFG